MTEILNKNYNLFQKKSVGLQGISIQLLLISYVMIGQEMDSNNKTAATQLTCYLWNLFYKEPAQEQQ